MVDFGALPPEITSALMYSGPGSTPMVGAASAWNALAAELNSAALGYQKVLTQLTSEEWAGPGSASMAQAAAPYVAWMQTSAVQAEQTANQARAAAAAYEAAFAATVPPPLVAANRAQVAQLTATNIMGQNTQLIAQLEAQYGQMWAQDAAAMYGYVGQSAAATKVTPFASPAQTTNAAGQSLQSAAVTQAASSATTSGTQNLSQAISSLPNAMQALASPAATTTTPDGLTSLWTMLTGQTSLPKSLSDIVSGYSPYSSLIYNSEGLPYFSMGMANNAVQSAKALGLLPAAAAAPAAAKGAADAAAAAGAAGLGGGLGAAPVAAGLGNATGVGRLVVPPSWLGSTPLATSAFPAPPVPVSAVNAVPDAAGAGNLLGGMPLAGVGGGAGGAAPKYGFRPTVMTRPTFAG